MSRLMLISYKIFGKDTHFSYIKCGIFHIIDMNNVEFSTLLALIALSAHKNTIFFKTKKERAKFGLKKFPFRNQKHERGIFQINLITLQNLFLYKMLGNNTLVGFNAYEINALR